MGTVWNRLRVPCRKKLLAFCILILIISLIDTAYTTKLILNQEAVEANPLPRFYINLGIPYFFAFKVLLIFTAWYVLHFIVWQKNPALCYGLSIFGALTYPLLFALGLWAVNFA